MLVNLLPYRVGLAEPLRYGVLFKHSLIMDITAAEIREDGAGEHRAGQYGGLRLSIDDIDQPTPADRMVHALMGRFTGFISPGSMALAWVDWLVHLSASPGKQQR